MNGFLACRDRAAMIASRHYLSRVLVYEEIINLSDKDMMEGTHTRYKTMGSSELLRATMRLIEDIMMQDAYDNFREPSQ